MKQYEFEMKNKKLGRVEHARCTARTEQVARAAIVEAYGSQFDVLDGCCNVWGAHHILGEIDCSGFTLSDDSNQLARI